MKIHPQTFSSPMTAPNQHERIRGAAVEFEAFLISQMLQASGLHRTPTEMGGGVGEDQFASLLTDAHARLLATRGGIGLGESLFRSIARNEAPHD